MSEYDITYRGVRRDNHGNRLLRKPPAPAPRPEPRAAGPHLVSVPYATREEASAAYEAAARMMDHAAAELKRFGVTAAGATALREENAAYLGRLAAIVRTGAEDPARVLELCALRTEAW